MKTTATAPTPDTPTVPAGIKPATFELLISSATALMQENGCAPTIAEVAKRSGISRATAYRCFPSRSAMLGAMVSHSLGPVRTFASEHAQGKDRVLDLFTRSFPRLSKYESTMRTAVQLSLEQQALEQAGLLKEQVFRRGHRIKILHKALEPLAKELPKDIYQQLHASLSLIYGIEIFIVLKDICNLKNKEVKTTMLWMADALIDAARQQAHTRHNSKPKKKTPL
jgi:AcrR family transcriptional regulator